MTRRLSRWVFVLLFPMIWSGCSAHSMAPGPAPDFTLDSLDGHTITLSELGDQIIVLDFWAIWCHPCVGAMPELEQLHENYADQGVTVLAINIEEDRDDVVEFMTVNDYTFTVLLDTDGRVTDAYDVQGIPYTTIVDREGEIHHVYSVSDAEDILDQLLEE